MSPDSDPEQSPCMTLWPMMMHHHTKFGYRRFSSWEDSIKMTHSCNLDDDHNRAIQSFHKTIQLTMMCHQTKKSGCKRISSSEDILESHILWSFTVTLILKTANQSFWKTMWLMMMYRHTKFGAKRFNNSNNTIWTNIHQQLEILLQPWPWTQHSNFFTRHSGLWYSTRKPSLVAKGSAVQKI